MIDEDFVMEIIDMTKIKGAWESLDEEYVLPYRAFYCTDNRDSILIREPTVIPEPAKTATTGQELYFEGLVLQPLKFIVSFVRADRSTQEAYVSFPPVYDFDRL